MNPSSWELDELIARTDYLRGPKGCGNSSGGSYKEWFHFLIFGEHINLLFNVSLLTDINTGELIPRVTVLVDINGAFSGQVLELKNAKAKPGSLNIAGDYGGFEFDGENFLLRLKLESLELDLALQPMIKPQFAGNVRLAEGSFSWLALPHLRANGIVRVKETTVLLRGEPAYHDHNWGHFSWSGSYSWVWAVATPVNPDGYGMVFDRVVDTRSMRTVAQGAMLLKGTDHLRTFLASEVDLLTTESRPVHAFRVPPVMRIAVPGAGPAIAKTCYMSAKRKRDNVTLKIFPSHTAEIGVPSDIDNQAPMILSEAFGTGIIKGSVNGQSFQNEVRGVYEQIQQGRAA
ncbi:MAG: hypothetical protein ACI9P7_000104 [Candidatus Azotimanducaceae bacterium]|jgi:hypothetical protein